MCLLHEAASHVLQHTFVATRMPKQVGDVKTKHDISHPMQEIRTLEGKLIKQFSEQLAVKYRLGSHAAELVYFPSLSKWLLMVGVSAETYEVIQSTVRSLEELKEKTECELKSILLTSGRVSSKQIPEDLRRLCRSR